MAARGRYVLGPGSWKKGEAIHFFIQCGLRPPECFSSVRATHIHGFPSFPFCFAILAAKSAQTSSCKRLLSPQMNLVTFKKFDGRRIHYTAISQHWRSILTAKIEFSESFSNRICAEAHSCYHHMFQPFFGRLTNRRRNKCFALHNTSIERLGHACKHRPRLEKMRPPTLRKKR